MITHFIFWDNVKYIPLLLCLCLVPVSGETADSSAQLSPTQTPTAKRGMFSKLLRNTAHPVVEASPAVPVNPEISEKSPVHSISSEQSSTGSKGSSAQRSLSKSSTAKSSYTKSPTASKQSTGSKGSFAQRSLSKSSTAKSADAKPTATSASYPTQSSGSSNKTGSGANRSTVSRSSSSRNSTIATPPSSHGRELAPGVRAASRVVESNVTVPMLAVGNATLQGVDDVSRLSVGFAGNTALYAGRTAYDLSQVPFEVASQISASGRRRGPGYEQAAAVIQKTRFSRSLAMLASRAVDNHPIFGDSRRTTFNRQIPHVLNPLPGCTSLSRSVSVSHDGLDMMAPTGTSVYAALPGVCIYSGREFSGYGNLVVLSHGKDLYTLYGHCSRNLVSYGSRVRAGDRIALSGNTGRSTAPHLHFEIRFESTPIDPLRYLTQ